MKDGTLKEKKAQAQLELATETRDLVKRVAAVPLVRTTYKRTAFQLPTNNEVGVCQQVMFLQRTAAPSPLQTGVMKIYSVEERV